MNQQPTNLGPVREFDESTIVDASETIVPEPGELRDLFAVDSLPEIRVEGGAHTPEFQFASILGKGGMGVVLAATQLPLHRQVAVKTLHSDKRGEKARRSLLEEAWVIGSLEHPNIVPIYTLGRDVDGRPMIVMKRIEGRSWREIIDEGERPLEWHLDVLLQVCRAVEYAHHRGIVHRDIKPSNVMRGNFGEVYLLDWGVAVSVDDDERFPSAQECDSLAGTPNYMAPEMAAQGNPIDERTDVYLLGAVLHELIVGSPPHLANSVAAVLLKAYQSTPADYPEDAPAGLASICIEAMNRAPDERYQSAADFRHAIEEFLERRASYELAGEATEKLRELESAIEGDAEVASQQAEVRDLFGQCHFGFDNALRVWADNPEAEIGQRESLIAMTRWELASKNVSAAAGLLDNLDEPPDELLARLDELRQRQASRDAELEAHRRERDLNVGATARVRLGIGVAIFFSVLPFAVSHAIHRGWMQHPEGVRSIALSFILLTFVGLFRIFGRSLSQNLINRRIMNVILFTAVCLPVIRTVGVLREIDVMDVLGFEMVLFGLAAAAVAIIASRLMFIAAAAFFAGAIASALMPHYTLEVFGVANAIVGIVMVIALRAPRAPEST